MSEECTHDCSSCGASCDHNAEAKDLIAPLNKDSAIKHVYAIMSGKGGVGKSSTTACLASAMAKKGYKVGIMDADITGPSIPTAFGLNTRAVGDGESIFPELTTGGIKVISLNLLLENKGDPVIWRGSLLGGVVKQVLRVCVVFKHALGIHMGYARIATLGFTLRPRGDLDGLVTNAAHLVDHFLKGPSVKDGGDDSQFHVLPLLYVDDGSGLTRLDAAKNRSHSGQDAFARDGRIGIVFQAVHKSIDDARCGLVIVCLNGLDVVGLMLAACEVYDDRMSRIVVDAHDATSSIEHRRVVLGTVIRPARRHGADGPAAHGVNANGVVVHAHQISLRIALIERRHASSRGHDGLAKQPLDEVGLVNAQICHGTHRGALGIKEPAARSRIDTPRLGPAVTKRRAEGQDIADFPASSSSLART